MHVVSREGRWYAHFQVYNPKTDKFRRRRRSTRVRDDGTADSRKRAESVAARWERRVANGHDSGKSKTVAQAFAARAERLELRKAPRSTVERAEYSAARVFDYFGPDFPCDELSTELLTKYATTRLATLVVASDSVAGRRREHGGVLRELADLRASVNVIAKGTFPQLPEFPPARVVDRWLTPDECASLLKVVPWKRARVIIVVMQTGLRKEEVFHLVRIAPGVGRLRETEVTEVEGGLKTGERTIPLTPLADAILAEGPLEHWTNQGRDLKAYAKKAGLGRVTWNDLRATPATQLLMAGVDHPKIAALLGHKSTRMVARRYARIENVEVTAADLALLPSYETGSKLCHESSHVEPPQDPSSPTDCG